MDFFLHAHLIYKARLEAGDYHGHKNATNFEKRGANKLTSNFPTQPVTVLDNSPHHCLQVDRRLSTCIVNKGMIWLGRKGTVSDETMSKYDLPVNSSTEAQQLSTQLNTHWLIMVMQFDCLHTCELNL